MLPYRIRHSAKPSTERTCVTYAMQYYYHYYHDYYSCCCCCGHGHYYTTSTTTTAPSYHRGPSPHSLSHYGDADHDPILPAIDLVKDPVRWSLDAFDAESWAEVHAQNLADFQMPASRSAP